MIDIFVYYIGLAILEYKKNRLLSKKFFDTVEELQRKEITDVNKIVKIALEIKKLNESKINEILFFYDINTFKKNKNKNNYSPKNKQNKEIKKYNTRNCITIDYIPINPSLFNSKE